jgi:Cys-rich repeat protein
LLTLPGCKDDAFFCTDDDQCMEGGAAGICQSNDLCSFPSDDCPSGQAYGEYAGTLAGRCVDEDDATSSTGGEVGGMSMTTESTTGGGGQTSNAITTGSPPDGTTTDPGETSGPSTGSDTTPDGPPNGSTCQTNDDCASGACYASILGSVCGDCLSDADCEFGCTPPYPLDPSRQWAVCNDGGLGDSCEDSAACASTDLQCVSFANVAGVLSISTCSECATSADCPGAMVCNEFFNANELLGGFACTNPGSLFDGSFCTVGPVGEAACMSHCSPGNYMGLFNFGVCSECGSDADCPDGLVCTPPELDLDAGTATTAMCQ